MSQNVTKRSRSMATTAALGIRLAVLMVDQLNDGTRADPARRRDLFRRLRVAVGGLAPSQTLSPKFAENMALWPAMWESGDYLAARFQMVQLVRKLRTYRDDWATDTAVAVEAGTPDNSPGQRVCAVAV